MMTDTTTIHSETFSEIDANALSAVQGGWGISDLKKLGKQALDSIGQHVATRTAAVAGAGTFGTIKHILPYARGLASQGLSKVGGVLRGAGTAVAEAAPEIAATAAEVAPEAALLAL
jgi:hypothetical protein